MMAALLLLCENWKKERKNLSWQVQQWNLLLIRTLPFGPLHIFLMCHTLEILSLTSLRPNYRLFGLQMTLQRKFFSNAWQNITGCYWHDQNNVNPKTQKKELWLDWIIRWKSMAIFHAWLLTSAWLLRACSIPSLSRNVWGEKRELVICSSVNKKLEGGIFFGVPPCSRI